MIKVEVNQDECNVKVEGPAIDLLAETSLAFGRVLYGILRNCPEGLKQELIKGVFECTLDEMKREGEDDAD